MTTHTPTTASPVEHVFRHAGDELIEWPDLRPPTYGQPWRWIAIVWPDRTRPDGWAALEWTPGERGWQIPPTLTHGDVIEFGIVGLDDRERPYSHTSDRWYGWLARVTLHAFVVTGPYPDAPTAARAAAPFVDEIRCAQLYLPTHVLDDDPLRHETHPHGPDR